MRRQYQQGILWKLINLPHASTKFTHNYRERGDGEDFLQKSIILAKLNELLDVR